MEMNIAAVESFAKCARVGQRGGNSSGEIAAYKLAKKVRDLSALMQDMDMDKQRGFCDALMLAAWPDSRDAVLTMIPK